MKPDPLVTIYMPTCNRVAAVQRAAESVLNQTYRNLELIVVADGCVDGTVDYLRGLAQQDARVKWLANETRKGAPACRNAALRMASGEFVTGLDDDDAFTSTRVEAFVRHWQLLEHSGELVNFIYAQSLILTERGSTVSRRASRVSVEDLFRQNSIGNQVFTRTQHLLDLGGFDEALPALQDLDCWIRLVKARGSGHLLDCPSYIFNDFDTADRITRSKKNRFRTATEVISAKHPEVGSLCKQRLMLQYLSGYYRFRISPPDLFRYFSWGIGPKAWMGLLRTLVDRVVIPH